ncbi:MAG: aminopeptidase [Candidatus Methanomethylophilus sp.]|jgi:aspartyl aminopeptidase|nr:aminopeptidase [Methanomethylophilus sp.]MCI2093465.1 aminopeptidase [Methanomethylophilus sp.]WII09170.1 aminopeptidase [Methanomassiliicoccales archaeon LGM-DZ1]
MASKKEEKSAGQKLEEELLMKPKIVGEADNGLLREAMDYAEEYKQFLHYKTEREILDYTLPLAQKAGYKEFKIGTKYDAGDKVYFNNRGKNLILMTFGKRPVSEGVRISVAHVDSPRLDFKPNPLFESTDMAYFKTHYYGGIKKYQWTVIPLSLHGVVTLADGKTIKVRVGEEPGDPRFCITDLLPHLARDQVSKPGNKIIDAEQLNVLIGSWPFKDDKVSQKVKLNIMEILHEKYGFKEEDFLSAELCAIPAYEPMDIGFDRSMVGAYGQDDKVCAFAQFKAEMDTKKPEFTTMMVFADKEETGSDGPTGMRSVFWKDFLEDVASAWGFPIRHVLRKSMCLSCDVNAAVDPAWPEAFEPQNCSFLGRGPVVSKYTGAGGKYSTNDASAEVMGYLRGILKEADVPWQVGELGKTDVGGGGTIAVDISIHNLDTVDMGVPVLSMHAPLEVTSKADDYLLYKAIYAYYNYKKPKTV